MKNQYRTNLCAEVNESNIGQKVTLSGWVNKKRSLGQLVFLELRDVSGIMQIAIDAEVSPKLIEMVAKIKNEYLIQIKGDVVLRDKETVNEKLKTGTIEVRAEEINVLNEAKTPPIYVDDADKANENIRLRYRYLDLRKPSMQQKILMRSRLYRIVREFLYEEGFHEIETPFLNKPTPEGARDFLVPSRVQPNKFFSLPQSPQLFKQLLMVSGFDRYFQIVKCFRDEDLRQDRQPEFTQIDMEMSFVTGEEVIDVNERLIQKIFKEILDHEIVLPIPRMTYDEAMNRYGSDKPDLRFDMQLTDISSIVKDSAFGVFTSVIKKGGSVRGMNVKGGSDRMIRRDLDRLVKVAETYGAKGLAWIRYTAEGMISPIAKFFTDTEKDAILSALGAEEGDLLLFVADKHEVALTALGQLRLHMADVMEIERKGFVFVWITDFPMFEYDEEEKRYFAVHHPFTSPTEHSVELLGKEPEKMRARAYDIVVNGVELGGGSVRIHKEAVQEKVFEQMGFSKEEAWEQFGFLLEAFQYGTPPHAGMAYGLDRLCMLLVDTENIKDVIAFPKNQNHGCVMTGAPTYASAHQLEELKIKTIKVEENDD